MVGQGRREKERHDLERLSRSANSTLLHIVGMHARTGYPCIARSCGDTNLENFMQGEKDVKYEICFQVYCHVRAVKYGS